MVFPKPTYVEPGGSKPLALHPGRRPMDLAFLGSDGLKRRNLLLYLFALALRALKFLLFIF
jgi:hypothetical protein